MTNLIERIEAAQGPDRELFWEAFNAAFPEPAPGCEPVWRPESPKQPIYHAWKTRQVAFGRFVDAEAWEQAALLLVPDGWVLNIGNDTSRCWAYVWDDVPDYNGEPYEARAKTIALALCAAALLAREAKP